MIDWLIDEDDEAWKMKPKSKYLTQVDSAGLNMDTNWNVDLEYKIYDVDEDIDKNMFVPVNNKCEY